MRTYYNYPKLSKEEQLDLYFKILPAIESAKARGSKEINVEDFNPISKRAYDKLSLSLCGLIYRLASRTGLEGEDLTDFTARSQITISRALLRFDPTKDTSFSSMIYLRLYGDSITFATELRKQRDLFSKSIDEQDDEGRKTLEPVAKVSLDSMLSVLTDREYNLISSVFKLNTSEDNCFPIIENALNGYGVLVVDQDTIDGILNKLYSLNLNYNHESE